MTTVKDGGFSMRNKWYVSILKRIVKKIRAAYPKMKITIREDSGFSNAPFYKLADDESLFYAVGLATNQRLKKRGEASEKYVFLLSFIQSWILGKLFSIINKQYCL